MKMRKVVLVVLLAVMMIGCSETEEDKYINALAKFGRLLNEQFGEFTQTFNEHGLRFSAHEYYDQLSVVIDTCEEAIALEPPESLEKYHEVLSQAMVEMV